MCCYLLTNYAQNGFILFVGCLDPTFLLHLIIFYQERMDALCCPPLMQKQNLESVSMIRVECHLTYCFVFLWLQLVTCIFFLFITYSLNVSLNTLNPNNTSGEYIYLPLPSFNLQLFILTFLTLTTSSTNL